MDKLTVSILTQMDTASYNAHHKACNLIANENYADAKLILERSISITASMIVILDNQDLFEPLQTKEPVTTE